MVTSEENGMHRNSYTTKVVGDTLLVLLSWGLVGHLKGPERRHHRATREQQKNKSTTICSSELLVVLMLTVSYKPMRFTLLT